MEKQSQVPDRNLGEEWLDWSGKPEEKIECGKIPFVVFSVVVVFIFLGMIVAFLWLIYPRLLQAGLVFAQIVNTIFALFSIVLGLWLVTFIISVNFEAAPLALVSFRPRLLIFLLGWSARLGGIFGFSRDRLANSFLKVNNTLTHAFKSRVVPEKLLLLLPRCLAKEIIDQLQGLKQRYNFEMHTVGGGSAARQIVHQKKPQAIVAVACERDLVSGVKDVSPYIPVLGFPNYRPQGPCKNTLVDLAEIEKAINFFLRRE